MSFEQRQEEIIRMVEEKLPEFAEACKNQSEGLLFHQDAFAADYQFPELELLGAAIKYAGIHGKRIIIEGTNRSTLNK